MLKNEMYSKRAVNPQRMEAILKHGGNSVLDVGCGNGKYVLSLTGTKRIEGCDYQSFESWTEKPELFKVADIKKLPYPDNSFETVSLFEVLEHIPDPVEALKECRRVCSKNIIITVPNCDITDGMRKSHLTYFHYTDDTHVNFFLKDTLEQTVRKAGFSVVDSGFINQMQPRFFLKEVYNLSGPVEKIVNKALSILSPRKYFLTLLIVASKNNATS